MTEATSAAEPASEEAVAAPTEMRERVPMWLAVAITVVVSLPFGLWLGDYNLPLWVAFIVWAEYFVLGGKPSAIKVIIPAFFIGVLGATCIITATLLFERFFDGAAIVAEHDVAAFVGMFLGFCVFLYALRYVPLDLFGSASLPHFNGVSMMLGVYFTAAFITAAPEGMDAIFEPALAGIGAALAGVLGCFLGWFNVTILFRRPVAQATHD